MPKVKPLSEFNRNQTKMIEELKKTGEPIYLTRNGEAAVVVMDAEAYDRNESFKERVIADEMRVYDDLMRGYDDYLNGRVTSADEAEQRIRSARGWA